MSADSQRVQITAGRQAVLGSGGSWSRNPIIVRRGGGFTGLVGSVGTETIEGVESATWLDATSPLNFAGLAHSPPPPPPPPPPTTGDFSVGASPARQPVPAGGSASYNVTVTPSTGFTGLAALTVTGLPTSGSASFTPGAGALFL